MLAIQLSGAGQLGSSAREHAARAGRDLVRAREFLYKVQGAISQRLDCWGALGFYESGWAALSAAKAHIFSMPKSTARSALLEQAIFQTTQFTNVKDSIFYECFPREAAAAEAAAEQAAEEASGFGASEDDTEKKATSLALGVIFGVAAVVGLVITMAASDRGPLPPSR